MKSVAVRRSTRMHLFGLTGGIASGKSAVAQRLRERGVPVIDADVLAREVVAPGTDGLAEVVQAFGRDVLLPDGSLDRKAVAAIVFSDPDKRRVLNALTHPRITRLTLERTQRLAAEGQPLACYEAALIVENGLADAFRPLVVVSAPVEVQIARTMKRDGCTEEEARRRVLSQMPLADKVKVADFVVENTGTLEDLRARADATLAAICGRLGIDPSRYGLDPMP
jgi:dephospho-CoA kinase